MILSIERMIELNASEDEVTGVSAPSLSAKGLSSNLKLEDLEGRLIAGRYKILRRIGKGGMGVVYLAQQTNLNREVVIKILAPQLVDDDSSVVRFEREARGLSRLQHPNIVTIYDFGQDSDLAYIAMEYADGETLSKYIKRCAPLRIEDFLPIAVQILRGIGEAHKLGLIHRDIKPSNIILCELEGEKNFVKILDFGLAKLAQGQEDVTKEQQLVGSASFLAPEQILQGQSDPRSDVYALGVLFYLMLTGQKPFGGPNDNVILYKHVNELAPKLSTCVQDFQMIPEGLSDVIDSCLSKNPDNRPQSANDLLAQFAQCLDLPELRASWSSVSFAKVDLQRLVDEGSETILRSSGERAAVRAEVPAGAVAAEGLAGAGALKVATVVSSLSDLRSAKGAHERNVILIVILAFVVVILALAAIFVRMRYAEKPVAESQGLAQQEIEQRSALERVQNLEKVLASVEVEVEARRWQNAEELLTTFEGDFKAYPELLTQATLLRSRVEVGKLLTQAELMQATDIEGSIALYTRVLAIDSSNSLAQERIASLRRQQEENQGGSIVFVNADALKGAELRIDGKLVEGGAQSPVSALAPGEYLIELKKSGYRDWSQKVRIEAGKSVDLSVELRRRSSGSKKSDGSLLLNSGKVKNSDLLLD